MKKLNSKKLSNYNCKIQQIEAQIQQKKAEKTNQSQNTGQQAIPANTNGSKTNGKDGANNLSDSSDLEKGSSINNKINIQI